MLFWRFHLAELLARRLVLSRDDDDLQRRLYIRNRAENLLDRADPESARELEHDGTIANQLLISQAISARLRRRKNRMNWNSCHADPICSDTKMLQVCRALARRGTVVIAGIIDPKPVRLEIRRDGDLRHAKLL